MRRGLKRDDIFTVGIEVAMTESMQHCDIVLPAATHFECDDLYAAYGHHWLQRAEPVIRRVGEALPNTEIFRRLAARFGFDDPCFKASDEELMDEAVDGDDPRLARHAAERHPDRPRRWRCAAPTDARSCSSTTCCRRRPRARSSWSPKRSPSRWGAEARLPQWRPVRSPFPLMLISPASDSRISSTLGGLHAAHGSPPLIMNPDDAERRGLTAGQQVRVWNDLGEVILPLEISDAVPAGVVATEKGAWLATSPTGQTIIGPRLGRRARRSG